MARVVSVLQELCQNSRRSSKFAPVTRADQRTAMLDQWLPSYLIGARATTTVAGWLSRCRIIAEPASEADLACPGPGNSAGRAAVARVLPCRDHLLPFQEADPRHLAVAGTSSIRPSACR